MKKILLSLSLLVAAFNVNAQSGCNDLIISEYVEGSNNNKAIELYNASPNPISLAGYRLVHFNNGSDSTTTVNNATGDYLLNLPTNITLASGQTYVIVVDLRDPAGTSTNFPVDPALQALADTFLCNNCAPGNVRVMCFNGNDAISLQKTGVAGFSNVDLLGIMGDPNMATASFWTDGNGVNWTRDKTLRRKNTVLTGVKANPILFDPSIEYDSLPRNTFTGLGAHACNCPVVSNINKLTSKNTIKVINPIANKTLEILNTNGEVAVEIFDLTGKLMLTKNTNTTRTYKLSLAHLNSGLYYVKIKSNQAQITQKIILD